MNARFWIWNGDGECYVRITLHSGTPIEFSGGGRHEEGWSAWGVKYTLENGVVTYEHWTDGTDCDGRLSTEQVYECKLEDLNRREANAEYGGAGVFLPEWKEVTASQRDYTAEACGY